MRQLFEGAKLALTVVAVIVGGCLFLWLFWLSDIQGIFYRIKGLVEWLFVAALFVALPLSSTAASQADDFDRFQLWNDCRPVALLAMPIPRAPGRLTAGALETAVRSRLERSNLYSEDPNNASWAYLIVGVNVLGPAFNVLIQYNKVMRDLATGLEFTTSAWQGGGMGEHGDRALYVVASVEQTADEFVREYLRVNAEACR